MPESVSPVVIAGAGPTGIACAIELGNRGIPAVCYDKGFLLHTLYHFPEEMRWYSTRDLLDIAGVPFAVPDAEIFSIRPRAGGGLVVILSDSSSEASAKEEAKDLPSSVETEARELSAPAAIIATGFFHNPRRLNIPGEDLPHVHRRYISAYPFHDRDVVVLGSRNSAAEAALDLYRHGARVTLVARAPAISERVKYWIKPDLENRIRAGKIRALFQTRIQEIRRDAVLVEGPAGKQSLRADAVFPLIGYEPDFAFFERCGILLEGPNRIPSHDLETLESNVPNPYLAGAILGGTEVGRIFIENSRHHATLIANSIDRHRRLVPA